MSLGERRVLLTVPEEACDWQLVNHVVDDALLMSSAESYRDELLNRSAEGLSAMKSLARSGIEGVLHAGLAAFQEGRDPVFDNV